MRNDADRFREIDDAVLRKCLLDMKICPQCRADLRTVALLDEVWGCENCKETWHLPSVKIAP